MTLIIDEVKGHFNLGDIITFPNSDEQWKVIAFVKNGMKIEKIKGGGTVNIVKVEANV